MIRYAIRRLFRYAKYAAAGAVIATVGAGLLGTLGSGMAFFAAPGLLGGAGIGLATAVVKVSSFCRTSHDRGTRAIQLGRACEAAEDAMGTPQTEMTELMAVWLETSTFTVQKLDV